ncbi:metallophosphoesterase [Methanobacterium petrolearium]|uniref:metallophosphoesterase n=1 Tax=Methanobacterium petrolearium TaxID=710190 RepID=UPI001AE6688D|nr:metallophosphoesterase [Methanobacterium petrolearium]MBP1945220.1 putative SbcD/Mre11-related phosphoesterase [Methanobacterium petrolearium]BDZ71154.1 phosphoesterase [Methanobacterium petrolearium]
MNYTNIYGAKILDLALEVEDYLVISDLHLGYEEALNYQGIMVPKFQYPKILKRTEDIHLRSDCSRIIINGDLKHEFGKISRQEWKETIKFIDYLKERFQEIILIKGNHDPLTPIIAEKTGLDVHPQFSTGNFMVMHGDKIPKKSDEIEEQTIVIGHEHPSVGIRSGERMEKVKCFLAGDFRDKKMIVMPSFNFITEGSDVLHEKPLSPFLKESNHGDLDVFGVENFETFYFGKINHLLRVQQEPYHYDPHFIEF